MKGESEGDFGRMGGCGEGWGYIVVLLTWDGLVKRWQKRIKKRSCFWKMSLFDAS